MASLEIRLWLTCSSAFLMCVCVGEEQGDDSEEKSKDGEELCSGKNHCLLVRYPRPSTSVNPTRAAAAQPTQAHEGTKHKECSSMQHPRYLSADELYRVPMN
ncbi:unnamed protein product [Miscanthus lutarioriparius]|uniref:Secreted protein n=1 Tax=Miscanthus lutarioriparius TaxID=422564 RepID=A0A811RJ42_9POAL|nr:unnamed protein product [Miscanthus lutarioriparius]